MTTQLCLATACGTVRLVSEVGSRIRQVRQLQGLTQYELSLAIHQHPNSVSRWERGTVRPSVDVIATIARSTGISADFLLGLIPVPRPLDRSS